MDQGGCGVDCSQVVRRLRDPSPSGIESGPAIRY